MAATGTARKRVTVKDQLSLLAFELECIAADGEFLMDMPMWKSFADFAKNWLRTIRKVRETQQHGGAIRRQGTEIVGIP
jgi:hypothetical protein